MHMDMIISLATLVGSLLLLVTGALRQDVIALLIILALMLTGVLTADEALSGFSSSVVIIIAAMFVVGKAIIHTGIARRVGDYIIKRGGADETRLMLLIMGAAALIGSFMSSTATAAIFIPITLTVAEKARINHRRLLMPLAVAALISGMMTLVATSPNIVVNHALISANHEGFGFFTFTPYGLATLAAAMLFMVFGGRRLLAAKDKPSERKRSPTIDDLLRYHSIEQSEYLMRIKPGSPFAGQSVAALKIGATFHITLLAVRRFENGRAVISSARPETVLDADDEMLFIASEERAEHCVLNAGLQPMELPPKLRRRFFQVVGIAEVMLNPSSSLIGKTLKDSGFQHLFHSMVLGIRRKGETVTDSIAELPLAFGDVLLVCGAWTDILQLDRFKDTYLLLTLPRDHREFIPGQDKQKTALFILAVMVALMAAGILPPVSAILAGAVTLVLARCVPLTSLYEIIDWPTIMLIAGMMPLALALQKSGVIGIVTEWFMAEAANLPAPGVLAGLFAVTVLLGCVMANTAVAVLLAPVAIQVGESLHIAPQACAMVVAIACSAVFVSPLGSPVNMLVREPGGYSFGDYVKTGLPLAAMALPIAVFLAWLMYL